jgi:hypothetical protein
VSATPTVSVVPPPAAEVGVPDGAVFVDHSGTRRRIWAVIGVTLSLLAIAYLALLTAAVLTSTGPGSAS